MYIKKTVVAVGVAVALAATTACGSGGTAEGPGSAVGDGVVKLGLTGPPSSLDPFNVSDSIATPYLSLVYDRLTQIVPGPSVAPMLATEWTSSEEGRVTTFTLRDDAKFTDGTPVTADAVAASLNYARDPSVSRNSQSLRVIESVTAEGPRTVVIRATRPAWDLPYSLAGIEGAIVNPAALTGEVSLDREVAGSGAYVVTRFAPGDRLIVEPSDGYWDPAAQNADQIELIGMPDDNARLNAFRTGQVDGMLVKQTQYNDLQQALRSSPDLNEIVFPARSFYALQFDLNAPGMSNEKYRQAVNFALDREGIAVSLLNNQCDPVYQPIPSGTPGHSSEVGERYAYDPDRARALVQESGVEQGVELPILVPAGISPQEEIAVTIQSQLNEVGINAVTKSTEISSMSQTFRSGGAAMLNNRLAGPAAGLTMERSYLLRHLFPTPPPAEFETLLLDSFDPALSDDERAGLWVQASDMASEQAYDAYICAVPTIFAYNDSLTGVEELGQADYRATFDLRSIGSTGGVAGENN